MDNFVRAICQKEGLDCGRVEPLSGGQVNQVFLVDGQYVIRIGAREDAYLRLKHETERLRALEGKIPVARVHAFGQYQGNTYQIQSFVRGQKLYRVWKDLSHAAQDTVAAQLAEAMQVIHSQAAPAFGYGREDSPTFNSWVGFLSDKFIRMLDELKTLRIAMAPGFVELAAEYFESHRSVLEGGAPGWVHGDLTLVNILVDGDRVTSLLDFEYGLNAPADYELWAIEAFCLYPNDWAEEDHEVYCTADFASLIPLLSKHYPTLFEIPHLRQRMDLYHIDATLSSYLAWRKDNLVSIPPERMAAKEFYMARITNILFDHGARMFWG